MIPIIGTGPTPGITEAQYKRRREIVDMLYANAADETSLRMAQRLAKSWAVDHDLPENDQTRTKKGQKQDGNKPQLIGKWSKTGQANKRDQRKTSEKQAKERDMS